METLRDVVEVLLSLHATASLICSLTPTDQDDKILARIYPLIEMAALNVGRAKEKSVRRNKKNR